MLPEVKLYFNLYVSGNHKTRPYEQHDYFVQQKQIAKCCVHQMSRSLKRMYQNVMILALKTKQSDN